MKILKSVLEGFLKKAELGSVESAIITFDKKGMSCKSVGKEKVKFCETNVPISGFIKFEEIGKVPIKDMKTLMKYTNRFNTNVIFNVKDEYLILKENSKRVTISLCAEDFVNEVPELDLSYNFSLKLDLKVLKEFISDMKAVPNSKMFFQVKGNKLSLLSKGDVDEIVSSIKIEKEPTEKIEVEIDPNYFEDVVNTFTGSEIELFLEDKYPLKIKETAGVIESSFIIAPRIEDEVNSKEDDSEDDDE